MYCQRVFLTQNIGPFSIQIFPKLTANLTNPKFQGEKSIYFFPYDDAVYLFLQLTELLFTCCSACFVTKFPNFKGPSHSPKVL